MRSLEVSSGKDEMDVSWRARKKVGPSLIAMEKDPIDLVLNADAAVPISRLADMIEATRLVISAAGL